MTVLALVLVIAMSVAGTIAFLTDTTDPITNTFTVGKVDITLTETFNTDTDGNGTKDAWQAQLIPGTTYTKDPVVTVTANSEDCWLFVKFEENGNPSTYLTYTSNLTPANGWTQGDDTDIPSNVWYRSVAAATTDQVFSVLTGDKVTVKTSVTKTMMDGLTDNTRPTLTFTACAVQSAGLDTAAAAYVEAPAAFSA